MWLQEACAPAVLFEGGVRQISTCSKLRVDPKLKEGAVEFLSMGIYDERTTR